MSRPRSELQSKLESLPGLTKAYFQPPESVKLKYDCIVYEPQRPMDVHADDKKYLHHKCYRLTLISRDPDCELADTILNEFQYITLESFYHTENLHHWVYSLFF